MCPSVVVLRQKKKVMAVNKAVLNPQKVTPSCLLQMTILHTTAPSCVDFTWIGL